MRLPLVLNLAAAALLIANTSAILNSNSSSAIRSANALDVEGTDDEERVVVSALTNLRPPAASKATRAKAVLQEPVPVNEKRESIFDQYREYLKDKGLLQEDKLKDILNNQKLYDLEKNGVGNPSVLVFLYNEFKDKPEALYAIIMGADRSQNDARKAGFTLSALAIDDYRRRLNPKELDEHYSFVSEDPSIEKILKKVLGLNKTPQ